MEVTEGTISRWETGERRPRGAAADRYAALLRQLEADLQMANPPPLPPDMVEGVAQALARAIVQAVRRDAADRASEQAPDSEIEDAVDTTPHTAA